MIRQIDGLQFALVLLRREAFFYRIGQLLVIYGSASELLVISA